MAEIRQGAHKGKVTFVSTIGKSWGDGENRTWYYDLKIDQDGKISDGQIGWKSDTPKVKEGDIVTFDKELDQKDRIKFKNMKVISGEQSEQKSSAQLPVVIENKSFEDIKIEMKIVSLELSIKMLERLDVMDIGKGNDYQLSNKFLEWFITHAGGNYKLFKPAYEALKSSISNVDIAPLYSDEKLLSKKILERASEIFTYFTTV